MYKTPTGFCGTFPFLFFRKGAYSMEKNKIGDVDDMIFADEQDRKYHSTK